MKKTLSLFLAAAVVLFLCGCGSTQPPLPSQSAPPTQAPDTTEETGAPTDAPTDAPTQLEETPEPTPEPTPTIEPSPTPEAPDAAGQGSLIFDIYQSWALCDINFDMAAEDIRFSSGPERSVLEIDGTQVEVAKPNLAQLFAVTDIDTTDKYKEFVFTERYDPDLADSEKPYSWLYWWDGTKLILMGGLMDVKFDGEWRASFNAADVIDGKGQVSCLARTEELTDIWYIAYYKTTGSARKLYEWRHTAAPVNEVGVLKCKTVCLIQTGHDESGRDKNKYASSEYDYYWIPTLEPTTKGRILNPAEGIKVIARPGDELTVIGTYGPTWFKVKTQDGIVGWIYCKQGHVGAYYATKGWTAADMFDGLVVAG